jgi:hypothetical protein
MTSAQVVAVSFCVFVCSAAEPDRWKGLLLNESTAQQAILVLGAPQKDAAGELEKLVKNKMFGSASVFFLKACKADVLRVLRYDTLEDFKTVSLVFKGEILVLIHLIPSSNNKIGATGLKGLYESATFRTIYTDQDFWNQSYLIEQSTGTLRPQTFPDTYWLIGTKDAEPKSNSLVIGTVWNFQGIGRMLAQAIGTPDANMPGFIHAIDLLSTAMLKAPKPKNKSLN